MNKSSKPSVSSTPKSSDRSEKHRLGSHIVETLKQRILHWEYPPGHPLGEESLSREFAVSRSPVREALHALEAAGFICRMPNRSYVVKQVLPAEVDEMYDLRLALELHAIDAIVLTPEKCQIIKDLLQSWKDMSVQEWDGKTMAKADEVFHETLASLHGNNSLLDCLKGINQRLFIFRTIDFEQSERLDNTCNQHVVILEALLAGDVKLARDTLKANVEYGRSYVDRSIRDALVRAYSKI